MAEDIPPLDPIEARLNGRMRLTVSAAELRALIAAAKREAVANARIVELEIELVTFLVLWAPRYAEMQSLDGLLPQHFDRLKELGARMDDFKRAAIPVPETAP